MHFSLALRRATQLRPDGVATIFGRRRTTYVRLAERAARCAGVLRGLGVKPGDRIGLLAANSDRYVEVLFGAWQAGAAIVPLSTQWTPAETAQALVDCGVRVLLADRRHGRTVSGSWTVVDLDGGGSRDGALDYEALFKDAQPVEPQQTTAEALAGVFYTSGATAAPKAVMLSHASLYINALAGLAEGISEENARFLLTTPLHHMAGMFFLLMQVIAGSAAVVSAAFSPQAALRLMEAEAVTHAGLTPSMIGALVDCPELDDFNLVNLKLIAYGVSPISDGVIARALRRLDRISFVQAYGLTELGPLAAVLPAWCHSREGRVAGKLRAAGRAAPHVELRIVNEQGEEVAHGRPGELVARGPGMMLGYWKRPDLTAEAFRDGWLRTGDVAWMDIDGYVYTVERLGQLIRSLGAPVYSTEVENALSQHPKVAACAVVGLPRGDGVDVIHAVIVPRADGAPSDLELAEHCRHLLEPEKRPTSFEFRSDLPISDVGKVLKGRLRPPPAV